MERLQKAKFFVVDQGILHGDALQPFACEEVMMRLAGQTSEPVVHIWRHSRAFIAGLRDRRLPYAEQALQELRTLGYSVAVRNSGGAAVPLQEGVVNVTVIFPKPKGTLDIYEDFAWMADMLSAVLTPLGVSFDRGEVTGSYCPGDYDLSIDGRKFCGIAQRRRIEAYSLQAFIIVEGDGTSTGQTAKLFYEHAAGGRTDLGSPQVEPHKMASLQQLTGRLTVEMFLGSLRERLSEWGGMEDHSLPKRYADEINEQMELMRRRYDR